MDLLAYFDMEIDEISAIQSVAPNQDWQDFTADFDPSKAEMYTCDNEHFKVAPLLFSHSTSFNPKTNGFVMAGGIVVGCPICGQSVRQIDQT